MIDFYRIDCVDRHRCKMEKTRGVNSQVQVRSSRILSNDKTFLCFFGVVTAVLVLCVRYGSYMDDGQINEPICAYAGDIRVATN